MLPQTFRLSPFRGIDRVDEKAEVIHGCKIIELGDVNDDRPVTIDRETLEQVVEFGNRPNKGLKARFCHPNMSNDGLGRYLGRWKNFRLEGDAVFADLHLAASAHDTPKGDIANYIIELATEDPECFGVSIATTWDTETMETLQESGKRTPLRISSMRAADLVDEPAATRGGLFSVDFEDAREIPAIVGEILRRHYSGADPATVLERAKDYIGRFYHFDFSNGGDSVKDTESTPDEMRAEDLDTVEVDYREEAVPYVEAFGDVGARWFLEGRDLLKCYKDEREQMLAELAALHEANAELRDKLDAALQAQGEEVLSMTPPAASDEEKKAEERAKKAEELAKIGVSEKVVRWGEAFAPAKR